jgi:hypothetical protein
VQGSTDASPPAVEGRAARYSREIVATLSLTLAATLLMVIPIWLVRYPPIIDYPNHLARWFMLAHIHDPGYGFGRMYSVHWGPYPYALVDFIAVGLQHFVNIYLAGRLILTMRVLSVPLATWFFLRQASPGNEYLALGAVLITYNPQFMMGSVQMEFSVAMCFLALGLWIIFLAHPNIWNWCLFMGVVTLLYLAHVVGFAVAGVTLTAFAVIARKPLRLLFLSWLGFVPGCVAFLYIRLWMAHVATPEAIGFSPLKSKLLALPYPFRGNHKAFDLAVIAAICTLAIVVALKDKESRLRIPWFATAVALVIVYFAAPAQIGDGGYFDVRILVFTFIVSLAAFRIGRYRRIVAIVLVLLVVTTCAEICHDFMSQQSSLAALEANSSVIPAQARVFPMELDDNNIALPARPFVHSLAYLVIDKGILTPAIFHLPDLHSLAMNGGIYCTNDPTTNLCGPFIKQAPDWAQVEKDFDYVWAYNLPEYRAQLERIGTPMVAVGGLQIFRIHK